MAFQSCGTPSPAMVSPSGPPAVQLPEVLIPVTPQELTQFFNLETGNPEVTAAILKACETHGVDPLVAFGLAGVESGYSAFALNDNGTSVDRGLFQLNNLSFPDLAPAQMFNPWINADRGIGHLKQALKEGKNLPVALAIYNAGVMRVQRGTVPRSTLDYIHLVQEKVDSLEEKFQQRYPGRTWP